MTFTQDWFTPNISFLSEMLKGLSARDGVRMLEIGCFEGRSTVWFLEHILSGPNSLIDVIDTFQGSPDHAEMHIDFGRVERLFLENTAAYSEKVRLFKGKSHAVLKTLSERYDAVYVDGSHVAEDVRLDANLVWPLLKTNGILIFDDYEWPTFGLPYHPDRPRQGIDLFLKEHASAVSIMGKGYQIAVSKHEAAFDTD